MLHDLKASWSSTSGSATSCSACPTGPPRSRAEPATMRTLEAKCTPCRPEPRVPRRAQSLFEVAQGADRVRARAPAASAQGLRLRVASRSCGVPHQGHRQYRRDRARARASSPLRPSFRPDAATSFCRIGSGSLGGKARGPRVNAELLLRRKTAALAFPDVAPSGLGDCARHGRLRSLPRREPSRDFAISRPGTTTSSVERFARGPASPEALRGAHGVP